MFNMVSEGIKMCYIYFYDGLNLELGSGRKITAKPVLSPNVQISEN